MAVAMVAQAMKTRSTVPVPGALDLVEEAVHLLRHRGAAALADYCIGSLPFSLGLLFFWSDMSRNPYAAGYGALAAAGMAALYIWMKVWQVRFCRRLLSVMNGSPPESFGCSRIWGAAARQALVHATGLLVLPVAALIMLPFGWVYAFYQNAAILDGPETRCLTHLYRDAVQQAALWPGQNHLLISMVTLFAMFVLLNAAIGVMALPYLLKWLLGIETVFTISGMHALTNTTFLAIVGVLTYLCVDPIIKAAYTLRCYYGRSRRTGDDLRAAIKPLSMALLLVTIGSVSGSICMAAASQPPGRAAGEEAFEVNGYGRRLNQSIEQVLQQRRFAWRMPREKNPPPAADRSGWLACSVRWLSGKIETGFAAIDRWIGFVAEWLRKRLPGSPADPAGGKDRRPLIRLFFYGVGGASILLLLWGLRRWMIDRAAKRPAAALPRRDPVVDINDEEIAAGDLPSERWLALSQELARSGDFPQALRALYLAVLTRLGDHGRLSLARYKSNRDYLNELARRAHAEPELFDAFGRCVSTFERVWYGMHPAGDRLLARFRAVSERIVALVRQTN